MSHQGVRSGDTETIWGFYRKLHLNIPNYNLELKTDALNISMSFGEGELWRSVFGVSGLNVSRAIMLPQPLAG